MPPRNTLPSGQSKHITTTTTTAVKATGGVVLRVINLAVVASIVTFNDGAGARFVLPASLPVGSFELGLDFPGKIEVVTAGNSNLIVVYA